jgi:hypothetical protein
MLQNNPNTPPNPGQNNPGKNLYEQGVDELKQGVEKAFNSFNEAYEKLDQQISDSNAKLAGVFGTTQQAVRGLRQEFAIAAPRIVELGGNFKDVEKIQENIAKQLGTNTITLGETVGDLFAGAQALGIESENIGGVVKSFADAGIEVVKIKENFQETADISRRVGVNAGTVFKNVQENLSNLNRYGFENGAAGLSKMAAQAAGLRINMNQIFEFAENVFDPEKAVDMVSAFQRMGVAAGDLADPFRLMYLASEDVGELQNQVVQMTQKFTYFDEKSKEFKVFPNAKRDLRELSQQMGISYEDLVKMSIGQQKLNMLSNEFKIPGVSEETKQLVANMAKMNQEGKYEVMVDGQAKVISELNEDDIKSLEQGPATLEEIAKAQLTNSELQNATLLSIATQLGAAPAGARAMGDLDELLRGTVSAVGDENKRVLGNTRAGIENIDKMVGSSYEKIQEALSGKGGLEGVAKLLGVAGTDIQIGLNNIGQKLNSEDFKNSLTKYISENNKLADLTKASASKLQSLLKEGTQTVVPEASKTTTDIKATQINQKIDFNPIEHRGAIKVEVTTPSGASQTLTDNQIFELFKNETFVKQMNRIISDNATSNVQYGTVPNKVGG